MFGGGGFGGFGQNNNNNQQQPQQSGGLFGAGSTSNAFGQSQTPAFGQPQNQAGGTGGGLFGAAQPAQSSGFSFGSSTNQAQNPAPAFGQPAQTKPAGFGGFGATTGGSTGGGFTFGSATNQAQPQTTPAFGSGGFGATANKPTGSLFGAPQQPAAVATFGAPAQPAGGLFGSSAGAMPTQGSSNPPYQPTTLKEESSDGLKAKDVFLDGICITFMPAYSNVSPEELRVQDYQQGRKTGPNGPQTGTTGGFSFGQPAAQNTTGGFGQPSGQTGGLFGAATSSTPQQSNPFGASQSTTGGLFGGQQQQQQPTGGLFGQPQQPQPQSQGGLFGSSGSQTGQTGGLFGASTTQPAQSTSFSFGSNNQAGASNTGGFSFGGTQPQNQQQNKPLFGGFGQSTSTQPNQQQSQPFSFGGQQQQPQQPATGAFGAPASSSGGFSFGAPASNAPKPGGLFGAATTTPATSTAPTFGGFGTQANAPKPGGFSFGGFGGTSGASAPQTSAAAPSGGLFGASQPAPTSQPTGGLFGSSTTQAPSTGGFSFGQPQQPQQQQQQQQPATGGFGGGLFGAQKPATGGLFGSSTQNQQSGSQQPASTGFGGGGGLFGSTNNNNNAAKPGGFSFGAPSTNQNQQAGGGLFGSSQPAPAGRTGGLFGSSQPAPSGATGGFSFNNSSSGGLFGQSQNNNQQNQNQFQQSQSQPQQQFQQPGLDRDPYGTDALFANGAAGSSQGPAIPFQLTQKKKKQPPLVIPFRSSPSNAGKITRLRGMTPSGGLGSSVSGTRSGTPGRESTPGSSLFAGTSVYGRSSSPSVFRGFSDEQSYLSPQAFVSRSSVKRLDLDQPGSSSTTVGGFGPSRSIFGPRAGSLLGDSPGGNNSFNRAGTAPVAHRGVTFSPAAETASRMRQSSVLNENQANVSQSQINDPDNSFASSIAPRRGQLFSDELPQQRRKEIDSNVINSSTPLGNPPRKTNMPLNNASSVANSPNTSIGGGGQAEVAEGGYFMEPPFDELRTWSYSDLAAVSNFVVGRKGFGQIAFEEPVDLSSVPDLADIPGGVVQIRLKECFVYPDLEDCRAQDGVKEGYTPIDKAPRGDGLNVPARVSLDKCWPVDRSTREPVTDPDHPRVKQLIAKLKKRADTKFVDYEADSGTWTFRVEHFSRYGLDDSDDNDEEEGATRAAGANKGAAAKGPRAIRSSKRVESEEDGDDDDGPPPIRRLDELSSSSQTEEDDELESPSEISEDMRESELGDGIPENEKVWKKFDSAPINSTPRPTSRGIRDRSSTPRTRAVLSPAPSRGGERAGSQTPQPWAATLGLEARRVQVMQASFFGQEKEKEVVRNNASTAFSPAPSLSLHQSQNQRKHPLPISSSQKKLENLSSASASAQRQDFSSPITSKQKSSSKNDGLSSDQVVPPARKLNRSDLAQSIVKGSDGIYVDAGLALGRSFRVGWGPDGSIIHNGTIVGASAGASFVDSARAQASASSSSKSTPPQSLSTLRMEKLKIFKNGTEEQVKKSDRLLQCQLAQSVILYDTDAECPEIRPHEDLRFSHFSAAFERDDRSQEASLWRLGVALFDEIDLKLAPNAPEELVKKVTDLRRKAAVSAWLSHTVSSTVETESRAHVAASRNEALVFSYLTGHQLERACSASLDAGNLRLATLLAQIGGGDLTFRQDVNEQLSTWRSEGVDAHISKDHRRLYELLAGNVTLSQGTASRSVREAIDQVQDLPIAGGLDWKRAFGLHLWYEVPASAPLEAAFARYESAIGGPGGTAPPLPPYRESASVGTIGRQKMIQSGDYDKDALYHLIKIYAQPTHDLESALDPHSFGPDSADYRLPWHVYCLISSILGLRDFWDRPEAGDEQLEYSSRADGLTSSYATQLELQGQWTWAAFVLLHLQLPSSRERAIKSLLNRNMSCLDQESEEFLSTRLSIPIEWIYESRAIEAKSRDSKWEEYELWLKARQWEQAHIVARDYLAPEALSRGETNLLTQMFAPLPLEDGAHGGRNEKGPLPGWNTGGRVYVDYAYCKKMALKMTKAWKLSDGNNAKINQDVEEMSKIVGELLELVPGLFNDIENNISHAMARSDMLVSLQTIAREISPCLSPSASEPVVTWDNVQKPEVEAIQNTADDYLNLLVGITA